MDTSFVNVEVGHDGLAINQDIQTAIDGFSGLNYKIKTFTYEQMLYHEFYRILDKRVFVSSIRTMKMMFKHLKERDYEFEVEPLDYPEKLESFLGRNISKVNIKEALLYKNSFIKPVDTKLFDGGVYKYDRQHAYFLQSGDDVEVWLSDLIPDIKSEWRCYVHNDELVHAACYSGNVRHTPNWDNIDRMINHYSYGDAPVAYGLDVAVTPTGEVLIEVSDFWAIAAYGLNPIKYAQMLHDRYSEMIVLD